MITDEMIDVAAKAIWSKYTVSKIAPEHLRGIIWEQLLDWQNQSTKISELVQLCRDEAIAVLTLVEPMIVKIEKDKIANLLSNRLRGVAQW